MLFSRFLVFCFRGVFLTLVIHLSAYNAVYGQSDSPFLIVDQYGYLPGAPKIAVIKDPQVGFDADNSFTPGSLYAVINNATGDTVFTGTPVSWRNGGTNTSSGDRVWHFDFTEVSATGTYYIADVEKNIRSYRFNISPSVYNEVLRQAMRTFFYQRSGFAKEEPYAEPGWADGASHIGPGQDRNARLFNATNDPETERDVSGGWYDAGDYNKYTRWNATYIVLMMQAYLERPEVWTDDYNIPESGNGIPDLLDEAKWGLDHLLRMQEEDGGVLSVVGAAHASPPSAATNPSRYGPPSTSATTAVAAAFAIASGVYRSIGMTEFADLLEEKAIAAWDWAEANPNVIFRNNDPAFGSQGLAAGQQETNDYGRLMGKLRAACFLFELTGDDKYREFFDDNYNKVNMFAWNFAFPFQAGNQDFLNHYTTVEGATLDVVSHINRVYGNAMMNGSENWPAITGKKDPYMAHIADYTWGSNGVKSRQGMMFYSLFQYDFNRLDSAQIADAAIGYINYTHGVNPLNFNYLSNMFRFGANNGVRELYHSWFRHGSRTWSRAGTSTYGPAPGFLTGGSNPSYDWDDCCPTGCGSASNNQMCFSESIYPPKGQPDQKSYKDFNNSWPLNSWSVTENSLGYQLPYIRLLSKFVNPEYDCNGDLHGEAFYDACGICSGGNTGREPSDDPGNCAVHRLEVIAENGSVTVPLPSDGELHNHGRIMRINAIADNGYVFSGWMGDASGTDNPLTIVMNVDKEIIANFEETYKLTVNSGSGSGEYVEGTEVDIEADSPPQGHVFDRWTGDTDYIDDVTGSISIVTMPADDITVTAVYAAELYILTVNHGSGSGEYAMDSVIVIEADTPPEGQVFDVWTGDVQTVADIDSSITTIIMPAADISVTATFMDDTLSVGIIYPGIDEKEVTLYPNPAAGEVRIIAPGFDAEAVVSLLDINGVIVMQELLGSGSELLIHTSALSGGTYIIRVSSGSKSVYARMILL